MNFCSIPKNLKKILNFLIAAGLNMADLPLARLPLERCFATEHILFRC